MKKINMILFFIILLPALLVWAGGDKEKSGSASSGQSVTVRLMTWDSGDGLEPFRVLITQFEKQNPGIKVDLQSTPQGYDDKVFTSHAAGDTADVLLFWNTSQFAEGGVLEDLTTYVEKDKFNMDQYYPIVKKWAVYKDKVWGLPKDFTPRLIFFNKKIFDAAGVSYPKEGWTFADFKDTVKKLNNGKTGADARYGFVALPGQTYMIQQYIWSNGGQLCSPDGKTASGYIDSSKVVEVVQWYKELYNMSVSAGAAEVYANLGQNEFQSGIVGMMDNGMWPIQSFNADTSLSYGIVTPPVPKAGMKFSPVLHASAWGMFAKSKNKEAAWKVIKFFGGVEGSEVAGEKKWAIPSIPAITEKLGFKTDTYLKEVVKVADMQRDVPTFIYSPKWFEADTEFQKALENIMMANAPIQETLTAAAKKMDKILQSN